MLQDDYEKRELYIREDSLARLQNMWISDNALAAKETYAPYLSIV